MLLQGLIKKMKTNTDALKIGMPKEETHESMVALITINLHSTALTTISDPSQFMLKIVIQ